MKSIRIKFVDFWDDFIPDNNFLYNRLKTRFDVIISDSPDFLFYSVFGTEHLKYDCIKIFYTGENQAPDFNIADYAIGFEKIDFGDRYLRFPYYYLIPEDFRKMECKTSFTSDDLKRKNKFCSFVYSNNNASPERSMIFDMLDKYKAISSGGKFKNNVGGPVKDKLEFQSQCKFSIAFENCSHSGYVTEKIVQSFAAKTIPIYWGDKSISETFNTEAFINVHDYSSLEDAVSEIIRIDNDDELFIKMINAPALRNPEDTLENAYAALDSFLTDILNQSPEEAERCSREYWGKRYLLNVRYREKAYRHSPRGILDTAYRKILWKNRTRLKILWKIDRLIKKIR